MEKVQVKKLHVPYGNGHACCFVLSSASRTLQQCRRLRKVQGEEVMVLVERMRSKVGHEELLE